ncbi:MAG: hypothetical protein J7K26_03525 [Candidatus Aenigmarchaeota archaeon]|nr:hypothetical protein [Candidatus Aenigmarchaeota archaeon]
MAYIQLQTKRETKPRNSDIVAYSPITGATITRAQASKGGRARTKRKFIANAFRRRIYCNKSCRLYPCPYMTLSFTIELDGRCAVKHMPYAIRERIVNFYLKGDLGLVNELRKILIKMAEYVDMDKDLKDLRIYEKILIDYIKILYGKKTRVEILTNAANFEQKQLAMKKAEKWVRKIIKNCDDKDDK